MNSSPTIVPIVGSSATAGLRSSTSARTIFVQVLSSSNRITRAGVTPFCTAMIAPSCHTIPSQPNEVDPGASASRITSPENTSTFSSPWE